MREETELSKEDELMYMDVALRIVAIHADKKGLDMIVSLSRELRKKGGDLDLKEICIIEEEVNARHKPKRAKKQVSAE